MRKPSRFKITHNGETQHLTNKAIAEIIGCSQQEYYRTAADLGHQEAFDYMMGNKPNSPRSWFLYKHTPPVIEVSE